MDAATSAQAFRESLNFAHGLIGLDGACESAESERVKGRCHRQWLKKRPLQQAESVTVDDLGGLDECLHDEEATLPDRMFSGHCLATSYLRALWEDSQWISQITLDLPEDAEGEGYLQADTLETKTSTSA